MLTVERYWPYPTAPIRRVAGFHFKEVDEQIHRWLSKLWQEVNIEVVATGRGICVHVWTDQLEEMRFVHPQDYVNHRCGAARRNPSFAATVDGVIEILATLGLPGLGGGRCD